jgi:hypothetical protein
VRGPFGIWLVSLAVTACAPRVHLDPTPFDEDDPEATARSPARAASWDSLPIAPPAPGAREGTIARTRLDAVLDAGAGPLLARVDVAAELDGDRFTGWRLIAIDPDHRPFAGVDLHPGDVLVAINGRTLAQPGDLHAVWEELRTAPAIVADLRRGQAKLQLRWTVTD